MQRKLLTSFFIIYTVVLLTQPCEDFQAALEINSQNTVGEISEPLCPDNESETETCSPFCICGCCGISVVHHGFTTLAITDRIAFTEATMASIYQSPPNGTYVQSIWQPPKV